MVAERHPVFSEYKVIMSGSTREKARVGNPYELDFLIAYEIDIEEVIEYPGDLLGFVRVVPHGEERSKFKEALDSEQQMVSDKLQFTFLCELYKILRNREYNKRDKRLRFGIFRAGDLPLTSARGFCQRLELSISNFRQYGVGASIQVELASPKYDGVEDTIDLVLSFNLKEKNLTKEERVGYWPKCAMAWTQHQANMNKECFNNIMTHGASVICKGPDPPILSGDFHSLMVKLNFLILRQ